MALIRYPGSKAKLAETIIEKFPAEMKMALWADASRWEYREPFFGAGAVGFRILNTLHSKSRVWLNDLDRWLVCMWQSVLSQPRKLCHHIASFTPSAEAFYEFKSQDGEDIDPVVAGFRKLATHQMSVSGFGVKSGGPLGGRNQENAQYPVNCRWNAERLQKDVIQLHRVLAAFREVKITCGDFECLIDDAPKECFIYLDPPYVEKGGQLYKHPMSDLDHTRLAEKVRQLDCTWALSYDDHPTVRELYSWAEVTEVYTTYTNATLKTNGEVKQRPKNREIVVTPLLSHGSSRLHCDIMHGA